IKPPLMAQAATRIGVCGSPGLARYGLASNGLAHKSQIKSHPARRKQFMEANVLRVKKLPRLCSHGRHHTTDSSGDPRGRDRSIVAAHCSDVNSRAGLEQTPIAGNIFHDGSAGWHEHFLFAV